MKRLARMFQFVFGCRHRHLSRVFTIKNRTYKVCFDCGEEFDRPARIRRSLPALRNSPVSALEGVNRSSARLGAFQSNPRCLEVSYLAQTREFEPVILYSLSVF